MKRKVVKGQLANAECARTVGPRRALAVVLTQAAVLTQIGGGTRGAAVPHESIVPAIQ